VDARLQALQTSTEALELDRRKTALWVARNAPRKALPAFLIVLAKETNQATRGAVATALGQIGDRAPVPALVNVLADQAARADVRGSAANALGQIGDPAILTDLQTCISDQYERPLVRFFAVAALGVHTAEPQPWLIPVANALRRSEEIDRHGVRKLRGAIVHFLSLRATTEAVPGASPGALATACAGSL
jgi:HEAT repeat protein